MRTAALALRLLRREWRAGELRLLLVALIIAVTAVTSVGFFTDRIEQVLQSQANELLGADLVVSSRHAIAEELFEAAAGFNLQRAQSLGLLSMVLTAEKNQLAAVKAVSPGYPLRGQLRIAERPFAPSSVTDAIPQAGTVWLDPTLSSQLGLEVGDKISVGEAEFKISAVLAQEPARRGNLFNIAPRLMMNLQDLPETQLVQVGSRINYQLLLAGEVDNVQAYRDYAEARLAPGEDLQGVEDARPEIRAALERARQFLGLAALVSMLLAGVAVAISARRFTLRHLDNCAVMRCLGASQSLIMRLYLIQMLCLGLVASLIGCLLGYLAHTILVDLLGSLVKVDLPPASLQPVAFGLLVGLVLLLGFAMPPLSALGGVSTLRVLRREIGASQRLSVYGLGAGLLVGLMLWQAGDPTLGIYMVLGTLAALLFLGGVAFILVRLLRPFRDRGGGAWRFGLANIARRAGSSVVQVVALGLGIMALLLLTLVRGDLLASWQDSLPPDAPNRFIINIQPDQQTALEAFFEREQLTAPELYPVVRGRLIEINGQVVSANDYQDNEYATGLLEREFNLSWTENIPNDNKITAGQWWTPEDIGKRLLSVEDGVAETLGIDLGDSLTFSVAGEEFSAKIESLRTVEWDSFQVNFYIIAAPGVLNEFPASHITSFYLPDDRAEALNDLVEALPNLTIIDVAAIMAQVRHIIERVTLAVEYVFLFTVLAGFLVLYAAIQSTQDERIHESAILRMLGARRSQLLQSLIVEFTVLGLLAGLVASIAASVLGYILAERVLNLPYTFNPWLWLVGVTLGTLIVGIIGAFGTRFILRQPPLQTLREA